MGTYSGAVLPRPATPSDLLRSGLESDPDGLALVSARTRLTWQALEDLSTTAPEIDHALGISDARALLAHRERDEDLAANERVARLPLGRIAYGGGTRGDVTLEELLEGDRQHSTFPALAPTAPAVVFFTSGSRVRAASGRWA